MPRTWRDTSRAADTGRTRGLHALIIKRTILDVAIDQEDITAMVDEILVRSSMRNSSPGCQQRALRMTVTGHCALRIKRLAGDRRTDTRSSVHHP